MTTPETIESHYSPALVHLGDDELLAEMENIRAILDGIKTTLGRLEMEVFHRMEERGATATLGWIPVGGLSSPEETPNDER